MKLNIGCGTDYREGFLNIDGSSSLPKVDKIIDISSVSLLEHFKELTVSYILAYDIIEHHYHWKAVEIMKDFYALLVHGGTCEIRVPDSEFIIKSWRLSLNQKLNLLFGGQDIAQGLDAEMDKSRKMHPEFFCHKFGWTRKKMEKELYDIGFSRVKTNRVGTNFITHAVK